MNLQMPEYDESHEVEEPKRTRVSLHMLVRRNLPPKATKGPHDKILEDLNKITHVRLDRENVGYIDSLELLGKSVTNVYLQQNYIEKIEGLETLQNLTFLTLSDNCIRVIEGLSHLSKLSFLDLSGNLINSFDIDELPQSLIILNLRGNKCTEMADYRGHIIQDLPKLRQLDGEEVTKTEQQEAGYCISSEDEGDEEFDIDQEEKEVEEATKTSQMFKDEMFESITNGILVRSQERLEDMLMDHKNKLLQLDRIREDNDLPPSPRTVFSARSARTPPILDASKRKKAGGKKLPKS